MYFNRYSLIQYNNAETQPKYLKNEINAPWIFFLVGMPPASPGSTPMSIQNRLWLFNINIYYLL